MEVAQKVKITYGKHGLIRFIGHLDTINTIFTAMRRAGLPLCYTEGFNPRIKASFSPSLSLGFTSDAEFLELFLNETVKTDRLKRSLQKELPDGITIKNVEEIALKNKSLNNAIKSVQYQFSFKNFNVEKCQLEKNRKKLLEENSILNMNISEDFDCTFIIGMDKGKMISPKEIARDLLEVGEDEVKKIEFTRKKFFLASMK